MEDPLPFPLPEENDLLKIFSLFPLLPQEIKYTILSFLKHSEIAYVSSVNKEWYDLCKRQKAWFKSFMSVPTLNRPPARVCHASACINDRIYIVGGHKPSVDNSYISTVLEDVWYYEIKERKWYLANSRTNLPLTESSGAVLNGKWYLFGGFSGDSVWKRVSRVYTFDFVTNDFQIFHEPRLGEIAPPSRSVHSLCIYNNQIFIYGGWDSRNIFNDLWCLDIETKKWTKIEYSKDSVNPPATRYHVAAVYENYMYICTGFLMKSHCEEMYRFHFETKTWELVATKGEKPSGRSRSRAVVHNDRLYLLGGFNMHTKKSLADFYEFNFKTHTWKRIDTQNTPTLSQHSCDLYGNILFVFGGFHEKAKNNLYSIMLK